MQCNSYRDIPKTIQMCYIEHKRQQMRNHISILPKLPKLPKKGQSNYRTDITVESVLKNDVECIYYESLNCYLRLILWTMLLRQNLYHKAALEYHGKVFQYKFVTVGKIFEYKISKMLLDVCFDLSLWWNLPNQDLVEWAIALHGMYESALVFI